MENVIQLPRQRKRIQIAPDKARRSAAWKSRAIAEGWYKRAVQEFLMTRVCGGVSASEQAVLWFIFNRTIHWRKEWEVITYSQFVNGVRKEDGTLVTCGCGLSRTTVIAALKNLIADGLVLSRPVCRFGQNLVEYRLPDLWEFRDLPRFAGKDMSFVVHGTDANGLKFEEAI